ncbi:barstar family protein [Nocardioides daeguensis]|uniref:Barstar (barnase inhibitor) domain-containing protein n=1 Tax=Nocardioides daeguensis TaxID=908359 RepID=A0ABP6UVH9_9ACTN|nr:barstar family protein [Nocardioides daeguensis]MBV6725709.1 barstar family protein [Nocardioides daeguensis]MCR1772776.1 barstar family protein [Nocardioides daeguensis]
MSGLAAVLAGRHTPGVHRWESALDVAAVRHAVEHAGWGFGYVDGAGLETRAEVLRAIGSALAFPDHYGANLDALNDCLRDLPGRTVLLWDAWAGLAHAEPRWFGLVVELLGDRGDAGPAVEVLLRGAGPADAVPLLA